MSVTLFTGPMFSGKTTRLMSDIMLTVLTEKKVLVIKYCADDRYTTSDNIISHSGMQFTSNEYVKIIKSAGNSLMNTIKENQLYDYLLADVSFIGIDEGQFYDDLIEFCKYWAIKDKHITISALDGNYKMEPFGQVCDLIPLCKKVIKLHGICMVCKTEKSSFTSKITDDKKIIDIGSADKYKTTCLKCYNIIAGLH